jgi:hypothetical protein
MAKARMKSIARIDQERKYKTTKNKWAKKTTRGWYVQVAWNKKKYTKFFSDTKFGGERGALKEAVAWRDATEQKIGKPQVTDTVVHPKLRSEGSRSPSITLISKDGRPAYQVFWIDDEGKYGRTSISINKWGKRGAKERAEEIRKDMKKKYYR